MEYKLDERLIIDDPEMAGRAFAKAAGRELDLSKTSEFISKEPETKVFYFNPVMERRDADGKDTWAAWIDSGETNEKGEPIFLSVIKHDAYYSGHFVGTGQFLVNGICSRNIYNGKKIEDNYRKFRKKHEVIRTRRKDQWRPRYEPLSTPCTMTASYDAGSVEPVYPVKKPEPQTGSMEPESGMSAITEEIFRDLLVPSWKDIRGLNTYIYVTGRRIGQLVRAGREEYFVKNKIGNVIVNTGLLNTYGRDILVLYRHFLKDDSYVAYKVVTGKAMYTEEGFTKEDASIRISPISFFNPGEEVFRAAMEDFDIDSRSLNHIVDERRARFPEEYRDMEAAEVVAKIMGALEIGLRLQERDPSYVKPIYTDGKVTWLLPLRLKASYNEEPELVMAIRKSGEYYQVKTVLPFDDSTKDKITALSLYRNNWC